MGNTPSAPEKPALPSAPEPSSVCPVDHSARQTYLDAASGRNKPPQPPPRPLANSQPSQPQLAPRLHQAGPLATDRVTSSIPRAATSPSTTTPSPSSAPIGSSESHPSNPTPANASNWIYPSEKMFFEAMRRKSYSPESKDMSVVVPIHNAVNERAWHEILSWERGSRRAVEQNRQCGGPKLRSFSGDSEKLSLRARWKTLLGYSRPFDRHDWVVQRCGGEDSAVEYLIDFYTGKDGPLSFHLDVRPKLNTWEGWRMRLGKWVGL